jgi:hypothetical protein
MNVFAPFAGLLTKASLSEFRYWTSRAVKGRQARTTGDPCRNDEERGENYKRGIDSRKPGKLPLNRRVFLRSICFLKLQANDELHLQRWHAGSKQIQPG